MTTIYTKDDFMHDVDERTIVVENYKRPLVLVAPHGYDDYNTSFFAKQLAKQLGCCAVINNGWQRSDTVNCTESLADCNKISHCVKPVVKEEFLDLITKCIANIERKILSLATIIIIHGVSKNSISKNTDVILGCGSKSRNSLSCTEDSKLALLYSLNKFGNMSAKIANEKTRFAGKHKNNLNQYFNKNYYIGISSIQMEINSRLRKPDAIAALSLPYFKESLEKYCEILYDEIEMPDDWKSYTRAIPEHK